ncbi:ABC transporter permease subunit [Streptomyces sp. MUM 178J]|uniref:ABC transporter permease subunit n=1 Tax=Streptomyces sp. MUM 178J TaxID=2791991 RepID=UPI001F03A89D|nr:ABC transporter permease subunit [Streptomyces sp. MUM 178J]WRQ81794.1 ABC transporter permease subunit [Streptomyces sp. MUM 178J]
MTDTVVKDKGAVDKGAGNVADKVADARSGGAAGLFGALGGGRSSVTWLTLLGLAVVLPVSALIWGGGWHDGWTVDLVAPLDSFADWVIANRDSHPLFLYFLLHISNFATDSVDAVSSLLTSLGWVGVLALATVGAWYAAGAGRRGLRVAGVTVGSLGAIGLMGLWDPAMETLALMIVAVAASALLGVVLGLAAGLSDRVQSALRPVLDTMQVLPAFAYLLPFVLIFGTGTPSALLTTVIYAAPPMVRLTSLGLRGADPTVMEAVTSLGASKFQRLRTARLPLARKEMLLGLNQTIMMALSMVVIASVVGAGGLGENVFTALSRKNFGMGLAAGVAIVLIAVWLDRVTAAAGVRSEAQPGRKAPAPGDGRKTALIAGGGAVAAIVAGQLVQREWPEAWTFDFAEPLNRFMDWVVGAFYTDVPVLGGTSEWAGNFTTWVLNPVREGMLAVPWWAMVLLAAAAALLVGTWRGAVTAAVSLGAVGVLGVWDKSMHTLSQVVVALAITLLLGFAIGILAARVPVVERLLRPVLDTMQTMPQFIYLIPVVQLFNAGRAAAIAAAAIYALPAVVRITAQGLKTASPATLEASRSLGARSWQQIVQVQWPLARPALLVAVNQGVVLVLAVVVIGGLVGGGGLGFDVVEGLKGSELGSGLIAGVAIVCLGLMLDKLTQPTSRAAASPASGASGK